MCVCLLAHHYVCEFIQVVASSNVLAMPGRHVGLSQLAGGVRYWHLVSGGLGCCSVSYCAPDRAPAKNGLAPNVSSAEVYSPCCRPGEGAWVYSQEWWGNSSLEICSVLPPNDFPFSEGLCPYSLLMPASFPTIQCFLLINSFQSFGHYPSTQMKPSNSLFQSIWTGYHTWI